MTGGRSRSGAPAGLRAGGGVTVSGVSVTFRVTGRDGPVTVKLTASERATVERAASEAGLGVSAWARAVLGDAWPEGGTSHAREILLAAAGADTLERAMRQARARHRALVRG